MRDPVVVTYARFKVVSCCALGIGLFFGFWLAISIQQMRQGPPDPRFATMCAGPKNPGEGLFVTMTKEGKYECWDNLR